VGGVGPVQGAGCGVVIEDVRSTESMPAKEGNGVVDQRVTVWTVEERENRHWVDHPRRERTRF